MEDNFYLQDSRSYVGNDVLWWATDGKGYTTDLREAHVYTKEQAQAYHKNRHTDIPWPKEYIDGKVRPAVDMQHIKLEDALKDTGIEVITPVRRKARAHTCAGCGRFLSVADFWAGPCSHCGFDNRP